MKDRRKIKRRRTDLITLQVQSAIAPFAQMANNLDTRLTSLQGSLDGHIEVYKNNGKEWKAAKEEMEKLSELVKGVSGKLDTLTTDTAPAVSFTRNAAGFKGIIDFIRNNVWPLVVVGGIIIYAVKTLS